MHYTVTYASVITEVELTVHFSEELKVRINVFLVDSNSVHSLVAVASPSIWHVLLPFKVPSMGLHCQITSITYPF